MSKRLPRSQEEGPWRLCTFEGDKDVYVISDDGTHDVHLEIRGDFASLREKTRYAKMLARRLNKATKLEGGKI